MSAAPYIRHSTSERLTRFFVYYGCVLAIVLSIKSIEVMPEFLVDAPEQMKDLLVRMWPVDWASFGYGEKNGVYIALLDTLAISFLATVLGLVLATPVGFLAARNVNRIVWLNAAARFILIATRSVSTLLWALFFVAMFGPGALAGTCAIAFHSIGFIGKMLSEALEESNKGTIEALSATGAPRLSRILYGYWPQVAPAYWSVALFRWDINVRESAVLGLVGAGGIGMALNAAIDLFKWDQVALILMVIFAVVAVSEVIVTWLRARLI